MKIKAATKDCRLVVRVKVSNIEKIDRKELERFFRTYLRGFLKPAILKANLVEYTGPIGISFAQKFKKPVLKRDFLFILEQIVISVQKLQSNQFNINGLIMDLQNVYVNEVTKEVQFVYLPTIAGLAKTNLVEFLESIAYSIVPADQNDREFVSRFIYFFRAMKPFDISKLEAFVANEDSSVVSIIRKQNAGQSGFMTNKQQHYYEHYDRKPIETPMTPVTMRRTNSGDDTALLMHEERNTNGNRLDNQYRDEDATGLLFSDGGYGNRSRPNPTPKYQSADEDATGLLFSEGGCGNGNRPNPTPKYQSADEDATGLLFSEGGYGNRNRPNPTPKYQSADEDATGLLFSEGSCGNGNRPNPAPIFNSEDEGATGLLFDENGENANPTELFDFSSNCYPTLVRVTTQEKVIVNKPVFRLGKEKSYVDFFVSNNPAVSRSHADIITRGDRYFVKDLNSKNHTYINGLRIAPLLETEIRDGDGLKLGNEEFIFYI